MRIHIFSRWSIQIRSYRNIFSKQLATAFVDLEKRSYFQKSIAIINLDLLHRFLIIFVPIWFIITSVMFIYLYINLRSGVLF